MPTRALNLARLGAPLGGVTYARKVLGYNPIAYWMLAEGTGSVAYDEVTDPAHADTGQSGDHVGISWTPPAYAPDGSRCPFYDGINDCTDVYTATLAGAFDGSEGTFAAWMKVFNVGVWTDGTARDVIRFQLDGDNEIYAQKRGTNNDFRFSYEAGGVVTRRDVASMTTVNWMHLALTWSATVDEVRAYLDGVQQGVTLNGLGVFAGSILAAVIGAASIAPAIIWHGYIAHAALFGRALAPTEVANLAVA